MNNTSTTWKPKQTAAALAVAVMLAACGSSDTTGSAPQMQGALSRQSAQQLPASAYVDVVQKIYIAYFGRPADAGGLANFTAQLASLNAPTDISALASAYGTDANLRALIDGFGASNESAALYPGASTKAFVTAVYDHLLNRAPDDGGLAFWVASIDNGTLSKSLASLSIAAAALSNTTDQGKRDAVLIGLKSSVANGFTTAVQNATGVYAGDDAAALARTMLASLSANSTTAAFQPVVDAVVADMKAGTATAKPYPLLLSYMSFLSRGQSTQSAVISGTCSGYATGSNSIPAQTTFEGKAALSVTVADTMYFSDCTPNPFTTTTVQYFDGTYTPLGSQDPGIDYSVFVNAARPLPVHVAVGDSGTFGTQTVYADSTRQSVTGRRELSYSIEADAGSATPASAVFNLKEQSYNASNVLQFTRQSRYRIATNGTVMALSQDDQYSDTSTVHLLSKLQQTTLSLTDTAIGTGAVAVAGNTVTMNYTGWLYDASAPNFRGTQFDTSVGRGAFSFQLGGGQVIPGFDQGVAGMKVGGKRTVIIPAALGYGYNNNGSIPAGATLVFDVELVSLK